MLFLSHPQKAPEWSMPWALAWGIKRWVWGVTCGLFSRSLIWGMRNRGVWLLSNTHLNRKREITEGAQKRGGLCAVGHLQDEWCWTWRTQNQDMHLAEELQHRKEMARVQLEILGAVRSLRLLCESSSILCLQGLRAGISERIKVN